MAIIGWDVGQATGGDPSALAILAPNGRRPHSVRPRWRIAHLQHLEPGLPYREQARQVAALGATLAARGHRPAFAVDGTGIGRAALELLREQTEAPSVGITWSSGKAANVSRWPDVTVPKSVLVEHLQVAVEQQALDVADSVEAAPAFWSEVRNFGRDKRGRMNARTGHDDLLAAVLVAMWLGDHIAEAESVVGCPLS